jgi:catechol 2,3-dioxygenase-like lactoylglutathione lyase family enzyme
MREIKGIHHITAIAGPAQENLDFYVGVLGLRLVKKSVNQDDPEPIIYSTLMLKVIQDRPNLFPLGANGAEPRWLRIEQRSLVSCSFR